MPPERSSTPLLGVRQAAFAARQVPPEAFIAARKGYRVLGWFGLALASIGLTDTLLLFVPPLWGNAQWAFTTGAQVISSLPMMAVALGALTVAARTEDSARVARVAGTVNLLLVLAIAGVLVLFIPAALEAVEVGSDAAQRGIRRMIFRVCLYAAVFGALHVALALKCFRGARHRLEGER